MKRTTLSILASGFAGTFLLVCLLIFFFTACQSGSSKTNEKSGVVKDTVAMKSDSTASALEHMLVDNKKDPSCGMPVTAGIGDTVHYKGKVLGFCSKECKDGFLKNPEGMIAAAELKK